MCATKSALPSATAAYELYLFLLFNRNTCAADRVETRLCLNAAHVAGGLSSPIKHFEDDEEFRCVG